MPETRRYILRRRRSGARLAARIAPAAREIFPTATRHVAAVFLRRDQSAKSLTPAAYLVFAPGRLRLRDNSGTSCGSEDRCAHRKLPCGAPATAAACG